MAITQISKITHRKGLNENLPQLSGAELGWALDARRLYIGNGKIVDGAPTIGNTEVLTQYSDILGITSTYTYKGTASGYEVVTGDPIVTRTLQQKFDDFVSVRDFGAIGDGVTDDTVAINKALEQLFTIEVNSKIRRSLFFPAGTYKVTDTIKIPTYAKLYGEGANSSIIKYYPSGSVVDAMVKTSDSKNQVGNDIGDYGATAPTNIEVNSMTFETTSEHDILLLESTTESSFENVHLKGPKTTSGVNGIDGSETNSAIRINGVASVISKNIIFDKCATIGTGFGMYINYKCNGITLSNSKISTHHKGVYLGEVPALGGPSGVRIVQNTFDDIRSEGIHIGAVSMNVSAFNTFYDVGTEFNGGTATPTSNIIKIENADNVSIGDMFERTHVDSIAFKRVSLNENASTAFDLSKKIVLGTYAREVGKISALTDNTVTATTIFTVDLTDTHTNVNIGTFKMDYAIKRDGIVRTGTLSIACDGGSPGTLSYDESYNENSPSGVIFSVTQIGTVVYVKYTASSTGNNATLSYSLERLY